MKHYWLISLIIFALINITGCYTQLATQNDYEFEEQPAEPHPNPGPEIPPKCLSCGNPDPPPPGGPHPIPDPPPDRPDDNYKYRKDKTRNPKTDRENNISSRELVRDTGGRNNLTEGGKGRIKDTGGRNNLTERGKVRR